MLCVPVFKLAAIFVSYVYLRIICLSSYHMSIFVSYENGRLRVFSCFGSFLLKKKKIGINSEKCIEYGK